MFYTAVMWPWDLMVKKHNAGKKCNNGNNKIIVILEMTIQVTWSQATWVKSSTLK